MIDFLKDIIRFKWLVIVLTLLFLIVSIFWAVNTPNEYKAEVMLMAVNDEGQGGLSAMSGQLGGLASLAGINVGGGGNDKVILATELINDWSFVDTFISDNNLKVFLIAVIGWDKLKDELIYDESIYDNNLNKWQIKDGVSQEPSDWLVFNEFKKRIILRQQKSSPIITASFEYYSPRLSKLWLDNLVKAINDKIQFNDMTESKMNIDYLTLKIESTEINEMRTVFYQLLQEQMKKLMLAEVRQEYILKKVGPIKQPEAKFKPHRPIMIILGGIFGFLLSLIIISLMPIILNLRTNNTI